MAGKADAKAYCRVCGSFEEKDINRMYTYRDKHQIIWYCLCKDCENKGEYIGDK